MIPLLNTHRCDITQSLLDYAQNEHSFKKGHCYNNAFILMTTYLGNSSVKGVIGYVLSSDGKQKVAVRHAWIEITDVYTKERKVIDVTMYADEYNPQDILNFNYLPVKEFTPREWLELTEKNNGIPCIENLEGEASIVKNLTFEGYKVLD